MKNFTFLMVSILLMGAADLVSAQTPIPTQTPLPVATDAAGQPVTKNQIRARIKAQEARINADSKVGKSTTDQAGAFSANLKAIRDKLKADYVENGKKELDSDQKAELTALLDESERSIGERNGLQNSK